MQYTTTADGQRVPISGPNDFVFTGQVVGEEKITAKSSSGDKVITSLRVRVINSDTTRTSPGEVFNIYQYTMGGSACEHWGGMSLTAQEMPIGAKVRVITPRLDIPFWELRARFLRAE